jgi:hypothetical protein
MARSRTGAYALASALTLSAALIMGSGTQAWAYTTPANDYDSVAGISFGSTGNYGIQAGFVSNCLLQPQDNSDFLTQEVWDGDALYWVEAGQFSGYDPINNHAYYSREWFWADQRPGGGYHEHFPAAAFSGTTGVLIMWLGDNEWGIYENGMPQQLSTSQPQSITQNGDEYAGTEYSASGPAGIEDQGEFTGLQYIDTSGNLDDWGSAGSITDHAWISASYHASDSLVDWNIPCTNGSTAVPAITPAVRSAPAKPGAAVPAAAVAQLRVSELSAAAADGDAHPTQVLAVATTESLGEQDATPGDRVAADPGQVVYLVTMKGDFSVRTLSPEGGVAKGHYLTFTLNPATFQAIDGGVSDQAPPTAPASLGEVTNLLSATG